VDEMTRVDEIVRRYRFEIILLVMILCGIVAASFFV